MPKGPVDYQKAIELYNSGCPLTTIARFFSVRREAIRKGLIRRGYTGRNLGKPATPDKCTQRTTHVISDKQRQAIAEANRRRDITPEYRANLSRGMKGKQHKPFSLEGRENMAAAHRGKPSGMLGKCHSLEAKARMRDTHKQAYLDGRPPAVWGHRVSYAGITFKSTWEMKLAKRLDYEGIAWVYEPKRFDLGDSTYLPDFYLPDYRKWLEVKGRLWRNTEEIEKVNAFRALGYDIELLMRAELKELQVI